MMILSFIPQLAIFDLIFPLILDHCSIRQEMSDLLLLVLIAIDNSRKVFRVSLKPALASKAYLLAS